MPLQYVPKVAVVLSFAFDHLRCSVVASLRFWLVFSSIADDYAEVVPSGGNCIAREPMATYLEDSTNLATTRYDDNKLFNYRELMKAGCQNGLLRIVTGKLRRQTIRWC